ncbi:MAG TPA: AAA family ATPase [Thiobacillaceae bacterium]|nr:AAA family ATPase [Thiobacillaceae bacterium]HNU64151.1 AAA family ATPase [Thiobacillaceae bacterium]
MDDPILPKTTPTNVVDAISTIVLDKEPQVRLALACLLAGGHLLIEDLPGLGKTLLAHALARTLGLEFKRVQCTNDLLPTDLLGVSIFHREENGFRFHPGPVFTQVLLADEINRASPKTQSALLEVMEERQSTVDGETRQLPRPFFVIATQNPVDQLSTHPLPEAQLDRFLMRIGLGYPSVAAELDILRGEDRRVRLAAMTPVLSPKELLDFQAVTARMHASTALLAYLHALVLRTRDSDRFRYGLSSRAAQALLAAARAWAVLRGGDHVLPADVQAVFPAVAAHRLGLGADTAKAEAAAREILATVAVA